MKRSAKNLQSEGIGKSPPEATQHGSLDADVSNGEETGKGHNRGERFHVGVELT